MSKTLTLIDAAWASARTLAQTGRRVDALALLDRLVIRPDLSQDLRIDAYLLAASLALDLERYSRARMYLRAVLLQEPHTPEAHFLLGQAYENDPYGCDERARKHYRRAIAQNGQCARYWAAYGQAALRTHRDRAGVKAINTAVAMNTRDATVITTAVNALCEANMPKRAWTIVNQARFLDAHNPLWQPLAQRVQYEMARVSQRKQPQPRASRNVIPFVRLVTTNGESRTVRTDAGSKPTPHFGRLPVRG